jgi:hypothetical protein
VLAHSTASLRTRHPRRISPTQTGARNRLAANGMARLLDKGIECRQVYMGTHAKVWMVEGAKDFEVFAP